MIRKVAKEFALVGMAPGALGAAKSLSGCAEDVQASDRIEAGGRTRFVVHKAIQSRFRDVKMWRKGGFDR
jgi:hypothetical protein